jgi:hypothetical protein
VNFWRSLAIFTVLEPVIFSASVLQPLVLLSHCDHSLFAPAELLQLQFETIAKARSPVAELRCSGTPASPVYSAFASTLSLTRNTAPRRERA